jgi:hypothetical protein
MVKDKYIFKYGPKTAHALACEIGDATKIRNTVLFFLCAFTLAPFIDKLWAHSRAIGAKEKKISLTKKQAFAFHLMCTNKYFDTDNALVNEVFTAIDRTF